MAHQHQSLRFALIICAIGGMLDAYSYMNASVFAGAQTGNVVILTVHLAERDWITAGRTAVPILSYALGSALGAALMLPHCKRLIPRPARATLVIEIIFLVLASLPPIADVPISLTVVLGMTAGLQMAIFSKTGPWGYSSTVMTSNITKLMTGIVDIIGGYKANERSQAAVYASILLTFAASALTTGLVHQYVGVGVLWFAAVVLLLTLSWLVYSER